MKKSKKRIDNRIRLGPLALALIENMCGKGAPTQKRLDDAIRTLTERKQRAHDLDEVMGSVEELRAEQWEASQRLLNGINLTRFLLEGVSDSVKGANLGDVIARLNDEADDLVKPVTRTHAELKTGLFRPSD